MSSVEELTVRVDALEARVRAIEVDQGSVGSKLNGILGAQDVMLHLLREQGLEVIRRGEQLDQLSQVLDQHTQTLAEHGEKLAEHDRRFDGIDTRLDGMDGKLDIIVAWIGEQPDDRRPPAG
jgi:hypothetical protein